SPTATSPRSSPVRSRCGWRSSPSSSCSGRWERGCGGAPARPTEILDHVFFLTRSVPRQRDPMHDAPVPVVVVHGVVLHAAVVPERERADAPLEAAGEFRLHLVLEQESEERDALVFGHPFEARSVGDVYVQRLAPGLRVRAHYGMLRSEFLGGARLFLDPILTSARHVG